jgi:hypothetical protein
MLSWSTYCRRFSRISGPAPECVALSSICQRYMATDIPDLVPLIRKNIELNLSPSVSGCAVTAESLD